jgi:hypothetical protein
MNKEEIIVEELAEEMYLQGYDIHPELLGKKVKSVGKKVVSAIKRIKKKGGVSISTPGGSAQISAKSTAVSTGVLPDDSWQEKLKKPQTMVLIAGGVILLYIITKKK